MRKETPKKKCHICGKEVNARGLAGHLRLMHKTKTITQVIKQDITQVKANNGGIITQVTTISQVIDKKLKNVTPLVTNRFYRNIFHTPCPGCDVIKDEEYLYVNNFGGGFNQSDDKYCSDCREKFILRYSSKS